MELSVLVTPCRQQYQHDGCLNFGDEKKHTIHLGIRKKKYILACQATKFSS
jgi:hypothetical protein